MNERSRHIRDRLIALRAMSHELYRWLFLEDGQGWARTDSDRAAETMRAVDVQATSVPASASSLLTLIQMHVFVDSADVFAVRLGEMKSKRRGPPPARLVV